MTRFACATVLALLLLAAPAQAFEACTYDAATHQVTATFGSEQTGILHQTGTQIRADGVPCGAATTANTDTIRVIGDDDIEQLIINLAGGRFSGGFTDEAGASDEVEFAVDLEGDSPDGGDAFIVGGTGADRITAGLLGQFPDQRNAANLNAGETTGVDADVVFADLRFVRVLGEAGADVLSANGGAGTGGADYAATLNGGPGADDLTAGTTTPGPGDDTIHSPVGGFTRISYFAAPNGTEIVLGDGSGGSWGGTAAGADGHGGTDTYDGRPSSMDGSDNARDVFTGSAVNTRFRGSGGDDAITGGAGMEYLSGGAGADTIRGGEGDDEIEGEAGDDAVHGDGGADIVDGGLGNDLETGGAGDDQLRQSGFSQTAAELANPNGADDLSGGPGTDSLEYGDPTAAFTPLTARTGGVAVDLDDVADDGAPGEGDNARTDIEDVVGGAGADTLIGDGDANRLSGFDGADTLRGGGGDDFLLGLGARGDFVEEVEAEVADEGDDLDGGEGADTIDGNEGDDVIEARDALADSLTCGPGLDSGNGDRVDSIAADCEAIALLTDPTPTPTPDPTPSATPSPTPTPPPPLVLPPPVVIPPPTVTPPVAKPAPKVAKLLSLQSTRRCASRRRFRIRVRREIRGTVKRVQISINGKRKKTVTGKRIGLPIDLRGLPKGRIRVRLRVELEDGRVATDTRRYRTCTPKRRKKRR